MTALIPWLHPALGLLAVVVLARAASLGRTVGAGGVHSAAARRRHRRVAPAAFALATLNWGLGLATVAWARPDLALAASRHFSVGTAIVALLAVGAGLSRAVPSDPRARRWHPWMGACALLLSGVQVFLGLQLTRW